MFFKLRSQTVGSHNTISHPSLYLIMTCFATTRREQIALEATKTPAMMKVLLMLEHFKQRLRCHLNSGTQDKV